MPKSGVGINRPAWPIDFSRVAPVPAAWLQDLPV